MRVNLPQANLVILSLLTIALVATYSQHSPAAAKMPPPTVVRFEGHALALTLTCRRGSEQRVRRGGWVDVPTLVFAVKLRNLGREPVRVFFPAGSFPMFIQPLHVSLVTDGGDIVKGDLTLPNWGSAGWSTERDWKLIRPRGYAVCEFSRDLAEFRGMCRRADAKDDARFLVRGVVTDRLFSYSYHDRVASRDGPDDGDTPVRRWAAAYADRPIGRTNALVFRLTAEGDLVQTFEAEPVGPPTEGVGERPGRE